MTTTDGRHTRWEQHRSDRRRELVSHALRAIRAHGSGVGMEEIAARAGTSKTVLYRHFGDRAGLWVAVTEAVHAYIRTGVEQALRLSDPADLGRMAGDLAEAYLALVERDPEIYRFMLARPAQGAASAMSPEGNLPDVIAAEVVDAIRGHLDQAGIDSTAAETWGHGLVGFIRAAADHWMATTPRPPRASVVEPIRQIFTPGFAGALAR